MAFRYCGIQTIYGDKSEFPLVNAKVHYDLVDVQALATLVQTYTYNSALNKPTDVIYVFPLPSDASVCSFKAIVNGERTIKGVVKEKEKAKAEYEAAVTQGRTAALFEESNVEIFQVTIGNIRPQETIEIHVSFACIISHDGDFDTLRLTFPCSIAPRYGEAPNSLLDYRASVRPWDYSLRQFQFSSAIEFSLSVQMTSYIKTVTSPSHPIQMMLGQTSEDDDTAKFDPFKARVTLSSPTFLEKDIVIVMGCQGLDQPRCIVECFDPEEGAVECTEAYALTLVPRFEVPPLPEQEYIFLVDRSGSMGSGGRMPAVRSSLQIMLRSLPPRGTSFNILSFGSKYSLLWPSSVAYTPESVQVASMHVDRMDANMGGTEIRAAIEAAFASRSDPTRPCTIFILTDGAVYDLQGVQTAVTQAVNAATKAGNILRLFCMGIGNSASKAMCDLISRSGRGTTVYVAENEKPDHKLMGLLRAARGAPVENITIDWGIGEGSDDFEIVNPQPEETQGQGSLPPLSLFDETSLPSINEMLALGPETTTMPLPPPARIQQAPLCESLASLYPGIRTNIFAIIRREDGGISSPSKTVAIKGTVMGGPVQQEVPVTQAMPPQTSADQKVKMLHVLAARALVQRFEDSVQGFKSAAQKAEILRIAERYGIVSSETSFVAIDEAGIPVDVKMKVDYIEQSAVAGGTSSLAHYTTNGKRRRVSGHSFPRPSAQQQMQPGYMTGSTAQAQGNPGLVQQQTVKRPRRRGKAPLRREPGTDQTRERERERDGIFLGLLNAGYAGDDMYVPKRAGTSASITGGLFGSDSPEPSLGGAVTPMISSLLSVATSSTAASLTIDALREPTFQGDISLGFPTQSVMPPSIEAFARGQTFQGAFTPSPVLSSMLGMPESGVTPPPSILSEASDPDGEMNNVWFTILCVAYLEIKFPEEKDVWVFMVEKAMGWVEETLEAHFGKDRDKMVRDELKQEAQKCIMV